MMNPREFFRSRSLASDGSVQPDTVVLHCANESRQELNISLLRLWLPRAGTKWQVIWLQHSLTLSTTSPPDNKRFVTVRVPKLQPSYAALELGTSAGPLWAHLRIKREALDISGGWVNEAANQEPYLKLLRHLHVNAGQIDHVAGYTDNPALYDRYPLKLLNRLWPLERWDTDSWLPKIHAVEFFGEPQFGGGKPMAPHEVFEKTAALSRQPPAHVRHPERRTHLALVCGTLRLSALRCLSRYGPGRRCVARIGSLGRTPHPLGRVQLGSCLHRRAGCHLDSCQ